jgi:hypothetical protein
MTKIPVFSVDNDVPVPEEREGSSVPMQTLEVGESILFPIGLRRNASAKASTIKRKTGKDFTIRQIDDDNCRIWRVA